MLVARHAEELHGELLHREHGFRLVAQQPFDIRTRKADQQIRRFKILMRGLAGHDLESHVQTRQRQDAVQEISDLRARFGNAVFGLAHYRFFFFEDEGNGFTSMIADAGDAGLADIRLVNHCCAMPTKLPVSQYSTKPED